VIVATELNRRPLQEPDMPSIEQIQDLSALVTTQIEVADLQETRLQGLTGGMRAVLVVKGDVLLTVDLQQARFEKVDPAARTAVLVLSKPKVQSPRVDEQRTRLVMLSSYGLWQVVPGDRASTDAVNQAYRSAQEQVAGAAMDPVLIARSQRQAESIVQCLFKVMRWDVVVRWKN
jgi:hypothetical protein